MKMATKTIMKKVNPVIPAKHPVDGGRQHPVFRCSEVSDWLKPVCKAYQGMLVHRPHVDLNHLQDFIDQARDRFPDRSKNHSKECPMRPGESDDSLQRRLDLSAQELLAPCGLPEEAELQIRSDAAEIGLIVAKLLPNAANLILKLEFIREDSCQRWHRDQYYARAVVAYNAASTEYMHNDFVDLWEMENCGKNDCMVKDRSKVHFAGIGNALFMKGTKYPGQATGLIHRSPYTPLNPDGSVITRMLFKVDVDEMRRPGQRIMMA
jgi:hypothetical protein